jgi:hypothetical protein
MRQHRLCVSLSRVSAAAYILPSVRNQPLNTCSRPMPCCQQVWHPFELLLLLLTLISCKLNNQYV